MTQAHHSKAIKNAPFGYAYHKIILDDNGKPVDYIFIDVNPAFEKLTELKAETIINRKVTEAIPGMAKEGDFDWIGYYGEIAVNGGEKEFEQYSGPLKKWYRVNAYSTEKHYFSTIFTDITQEKLIAETSKYFLQNPEKEPDYQKICNDLLAITNAKYIALNILDDNGKDFTTVAISGIDKHIKKVSELLGFEIAGKKWKYDPVRAEKIKNKQITRFKRISDLTGDIFPKKTITLIENFFKAGEIAVIKIMKEERFLGDFTVIMHEGETLKNESLWEIFAQQFGMFLQKLGAEKEFKKESILRKQLLDHIPGYLALVLKKDIREIVASNKAAISVGAVPGKTCFGTSAMRNDPCPFCLADEMWKTGETQNIEVEYRGRWYEGHWAPLSDDLYMHYIKDITETKKAEETLKTYEKIFFNTNDMLAIIGFDGYFKDINPSWHKNTGWSKKELMSKPFLKFIHHDDKNPTINTFNSACKGSKILYFESRFICADETEKWFLWDFIPYTSENILIGVARDNTRTIMLEKEKDIFNTLLVERLKELTFLNNLSKTVYDSEAEVSRIFKHITSLMPHAFQNPARTFVKISNNKISRQTKNFKKTEFEISQTFKTETNGNINIKVYADFQPGENSKPFFNEKYKLLKTVADILNNYIQKNEAIEKEQLYYRKFVELFNNVNDIVFTSDQYGNILNINSEFEKQFGFKAQPKLNVFSILLPESAFAIKQKMIINLKNKSRQDSFDVDIITIKGKIFTCEVRLNIKYKENRIYEIFGIARNVTDLRKSQKILMRTIINTEEKERKRFAEELHDGIGPLLSGINMYIEKIKSQEIISTENQKLLKYCNELVNDSISQIRIISNDLMPRLLGKHGLAKSLNSFIGKINHLKSINIKLSGDEIETDDIQHEAGIILYRGITELINNTLKHSNAKNIIIDITKKENFIVVNYSDDGKGISLKKIHQTRKHAGLGIKNLISRVKSINGTINFADNNQQGFSTEIIIPS